MSEGSALDCSGPSLPMQPDPTFLYLLARLSQALCGHCLFFFFFFFFLFLVIPVLFSWINILQDVVLYTEISAIHYFYLYMHIHDCVCAQVSVCFSCKCVILNIRNALQGETESCGTEYQEITCGFYLTAETSVFSFLYIKLYFVFQIAFWIGYCVTNWLLSVWWLHS